MRIVYIGLKEVKADNVSGTGLTWTRGQIHEVEDETKVAKLLEHPLIWRNADSNYEMIPEPRVVAPAPRVNIVPNGETSMFWEPIIIPVPEAVFARLQKKELTSVFMTPEDADIFAEWKLGQGTATDAAPVETGPKVDRRTKEYRDGLERKAG